MNDDLIYIEPRQEAVLRYDDVLVSCSTVPEAWLTWAQLELDQSFGSTGDRYNNATVEACWATLKRELAWIHATKTWPTRTALRSALFDYIEGFYNPERIQQRLGQRSPINFEQDSAA